jgi:hypothetical protein
MKILKEILGERVYFLKKYWMLINLMRPARPCFQSHARHFECETPELETGAVHSFRKIKYFIINRFKMIILQLLKT